MVSPMAASPPVHALVDDLFFRAKIEATAGAAGVPVALARAATEIPESDEPGLVLVDLSLASDDPVAAIRTLKERAPAPTVIAFGAHRDVELLARARAAGADRVLARSALTERLPEILAGAAR
jgi:DNA-binding NarL/FixJ family response regulator